MYSGSKVSKGYRWRNELVNKLLPYIKDGNEARKLGFPNERELLNNLTRGYIPVFFPTSIPTTKGGTWIFPLSLRPNHWWKKEIEDIGKEFAKVSGRLNDKRIKEIFKKHNWEVDKPVEGISIIDKRGRWRYDAYKDKIAVEVELTSRSQIFKDTFKFLIGQAMGQIDVGIIMVRKDREGTKPYFGSVDPDSHPIYTTLPMLDVAFHGFPNSAR